MSKDPWVEFDRKTELQISRAEDAIRDMAKDRRETATRILCALMTGMAAEPKAFMEGFAYMPKLAVKLAKRLEVELVQENMEDAQRKQSLQDLQGFSQEGQV